MLPWLPMGILTTIESVDHLVRPYALDSELQRALMHGRIRSDRNEPISDADNQLPEHAFLRSDTERAIYYYLQLYPEIRNDVEANYRLSDPINGKSAEVDFYFARARLVVEIDGPEHGSGERKRLDDQRDRALRKLGIEVKRFTNEAVRQNLTGILQKILEVHHQRCRINL